MIERQEAALNALIRAAKYECYAWNNYDPEEYGAAYNNRLRAVRRCRKLGICNYDITNAIDEASYDYAHSVNV